MTGVPEQGSRKKIQYLASRLLYDAYGSVVAVLAPGAVFEVWMGGQWQAIEDYRHCYSTLTTEYVDTTFDEPHLNGSPFNNEGEKAKRRQRGGAC